MVPPSFVAAGDVLTTTNELFSEAPRVVLVPIPDAESSSDISWQLHKISSSRVGKSISGRSSQPEEDSSVLDSKRTTCFAPGVGMSGIRRTSKATWELASVGTLSLLRSIGSNDTRSCSASLSACVGG